MKKRGPSSRGHRWCSPSSTCCPTTPPCCDWPRWLLLFWWWTEWRVILFVICEPLLQKQTTVLFPTINLNSEMQKIMIKTQALNTWLIHVWYDNVYIMRIPHLSLSPRRVPRTETSATLHPVALVALEGKQVRQPALGHQCILHWSGHRIFAETVSSFQILVIV